MHAVSCQIPIAANALTHSLGWGFWLMMAGMFLCSAAYSLFWLWMLIHALRFEPDKFFWGWLLVVAPFPGAIVYAVVRYFPAGDWKAPAWWLRISRGRELQRLEAEAETIGNCHQFVKWGDALRETRRWDAARAAYAQALQKDAESLPALWGAALVAEKRQALDDVLSHCRAILNRDPQYKFGDVSLLYAKTLAAKGDAVAAAAHLETHCQRWRHPDGVLMLAEHHAAKGDRSTARRHLQDLLRDLNTSPRAIAMRYGRERSRARRLLKTLPNA